MTILIICLAAAAVAAFFFAKSIHFIGPTEVGLVFKRFGAKLTDDNPIAFQGEAGYQAKLLMPGVRVKLWPLFSVSKFPWVQVPAGEIGVVIAQVGEPLDTGMKSARYDKKFGNFSDVEGFVTGGGQKGVQRPVLPPGSLLPLHPLAFVVLTASAVYGQAISDSVSGQMSLDSFDLRPEQLKVTVIAPRDSQDVVGIVSTLEGKASTTGDIATRLGGWVDVSSAEAKSSDAEIIESLLNSHNDIHDNFQNFQAFIDAGGCIGLQHDPLMYGAYLLNPFLVSVELVPMLVVRQGEVAVVKSYVGLPTIDTSGTEFKFGSIVRPGHRGIWCEPLRTGKYAINPRCYQAEIVPTSILTLNWANAVSQAHNLDASLSPIDAKSREGFLFRIDLQVQIHVPDTKAPKVISMVGTMQNLVNEVLQSAVGNYFRNAVQKQPAIEFIQMRDEVQSRSQDYITSYLSKYEVETKGIYIQDVQFPEELVSVLTQREIANQERSTFEEQQRAQVTRVELEKARGTADMQAQLAQAQVSVDIRKAEAEARKAEADGEASFTETTGRAEAAKREAVGLAEARAMEALGLARAAGFEAQVRALGIEATSAVAIAQAVSDGKVKIVPEVMVSGGGSLDGLAGVLMRTLSATAAPASTPAGMPPVLVAGASVTGNTAAQAESGPSEDPMGESGYGQPRQTGG